MRFFFQVSISLASAIGIATPAIGDPNEHACAVSKGAEQIAGCTAWLASAKLSDAQKADAFLIRGMAYFDDKDYSRAIADLTHAIALKPGDTTALEWRANAYMMQDDYARAVADYGEVIQLEPSLAVAFNNRGWAYYRLKKYARAIADYDAAVRRDPQNAQALYIRGLAKGKLGQNAGSKADISRAIAIDPNIVTKLATARSGGG